MWGKIQNKTIKTMNIEVKRSSGKWTVNGENPKNLSPSESKSLDALIVGARLQELDIKGEKEIKSLPDWGTLLTDKNGN